MLVAGLPAQLGPPGVPQSLQWDTWQTAGLLGGRSWFSVLRERQEILGLPHPHFQRSYLESQAA